nr:terpene synthase [Micromonospora sp. DSM 115978]
MRNFAAAALIGPPFPARTNRYAADVGARSSRWAAERGLVATTAAARRLTEANVGDLAGRAGPDADLDHLQLLADLFSWLFAFDDRCDDDGLGDDPTRLAPVVGKLLDVLDLLGGADPAAAVPAAGPAGAALHDLCRRIRQQRQPPVLLRFTAQFRSYLLALLWEAANRRQARVPTVAEYRQMRRHTGGVHPSFTLTDLAHHALPDAAQRADPRLSALDGLAADLVCWCNDLFSYDKEGTDGHNLARAIACETGQDESTALAEAAGRFNAGVQAYLKLEAAMLPAAGPAVTRVLAARRCWIRGAYDWSLRSVRYR